MTPIAQEPDTAITAMVFSPTFIPDRIHDRVQVKVSAQPLTPLKVKFERLLAEASILTAAVFRTFNETESVMQPVPDIKAARGIIVSAEAETTVDIRQNNRAATERISLRLREYIDRRWCTVAGRKPARSP